MQRCSHAAEELAAGDAGLRRARYRCDSPKLCGWANPWRKQGGEGKGGAVLAGSVGDNLRGWALAPAPRSLLGGGTACWWERGWLPRTLLRLLALTLFPSVPSFIIYRFLLLFSSLAGSQCSWLWKGAVLWGTQGQQKMLLRCSSASPLCCTDGTVWHAQLIKLLNTFPSKEKSQNPVCKSPLSPGVPHAVHTLLFQRLLLGMDTRGWESNVRSSGYACFVQLKVVGEK